MAGTISKMELRRSVRAQLERDGAKVVIDEVSVPFLEGSEIDYVTEVIGSAFRISNPNATAVCGCGTSFALS